VTTLTITRGRRRGRYLPGDDGRPGRACLRAGWPVRHGEIRTGTGTWTVRRHGWRRVTLGDGDPLLARPGRDDVVVPGKGARRRLGNLPELAHLPGDAHPRLGEDDAAPGRSERPRLSGPRSAATGNSATS
jgi:hypothetical protein